MSQENENKAIVARWFTQFWDETYNPSIVGKLAAPNTCFCTICSMMSHVVAARTYQGIHVWIS